MRKTRRRRNGRQLCRLRGYGKYQKHLNVNSPAAESKATFLIETHTQNTLRPNRIDILL